VKVLVQQGLYCRDIEEAAKTLQQSVEKLRAQADLCDKEQSVEIMALIKESITLQHSERIRGDQREARAEARHEEVMRQALDLASTVASLRTSDDAQRPTIATIMNLLTEEKRDREKAEKTWLTTVRQEIEREKTAREAMARENMCKTASDFSSCASSQLINTDLHGQLSVMKQNLSRPSSPAPTLHHAEIQGLLFGCDKAPDADIDYHGHVNTDQGLATAVATTTKFRQWFTSSHSSILILTSSGPLDADASSNFTASMAKICMQLPEASTISYFCQMQQQTDLNGEPVAVMVSNLCLQLLASQRYDLRLWSSKLRMLDHERYLGLKDLNYLQSFFKHLLLPARHGGSRGPGVLFCLIDNVEALQCDAGPGTVRAFVEYVAQMVHTQDLFPVILKVLLVRPDRTLDDILGNVYDSELLVVHDRFDGDEDRPTQRELEFQLERARRMN
jgi:hypothetical protein